MITVSHSVTIISFRAQEGLVRTDRFYHAASEEDSDLGDFIVEDSDDEDEAAEFDEASEEVWTSKMQLMLSSIMASAIE